MKKFIYILLFALATTISISAHTEKAVAQHNNNNNDGPIGGSFPIPNKTIRIYIILNQLINPF